ncbi:MAG: hypothetical protein FJY97_13855 [candidate division Zixibacteria bacterium]|nr:hypothetical protein [candidate division Zixibacteria bacterium]
MADGRIASVEHPDFIAHAPGTRTTCVYETDGAFHLIDLLRVSEREVRRNDTVAM